MSNRIISKTSYTEYLKCPKMLWYNVHGYQKQISENAQRTLDNGTEFGKLARDYFGECVTVEGENIAAMLRKTREYLETGAPNIAEAAFSAAGGYCQVDILHKNTSGSFDLVEVKSGSQIKSYYYDDIAFQYYVVKAVLPVEHCYLLHMNSSYRRQGPLTCELFELTDVTEQIKKKLVPKTKKTKKGETDPGEGRDLIGEAIRTIGEMLDGELPDLRVHSGCDDQWECPFMEECVSCLGTEEQALMHISGLTWKQRIRCLDAGSVLYPKGKELLALADDEVIFDRERIRNFLGTVRYPLYLLDFESIQSIIPQFDGQKPWQQMPFQYSLHVMSGPDATRDELVHREFLWDSPGDPRAAMAEQLTYDIPQDACVMAYNMMFEKSILAELAESLPQYAEHLLTISDNCVDLMVPFSTKAYYKGDMRGSYSIKAVLPSCCPEDPELDYHRLEEVQNGTMAQEKYVVLCGMQEGEEKNRLRHHMLEYCKLDTYAMYKVLAFLYRVSG